MTKIHPLFVDIVFHTDLSTNFVFDARDEQTLLMRNGFALSFACSDAFAYFFCFEAKTSAVDVEEFILRFWQSPRFCCFVDVHDRCRCPKIDDL